MPDSVLGVIRDENRLQALKDQNILDTEPEPAFDRIARLAAEMLGTESALVNFVGADRQWFKSAVGFDGKGTGLDVSFCVYTIGKGEALIIEDAAEDERLADNPYVTEGGVRFYAGVPLKTKDGHRIGTLCVLDTEPQSPSDEAVHQLSDLAGIVEDELRLRREQAERREAEQKLRQSRERLQMAVQGGDIGIWNWDLGTGEVIFNQQWAEMLGYAREELDFHFSTWKDLMHPEGLDWALDELEMYISGEIDTYAPEIRMQTKGEEWKWIQTIGKVVDRDDDGNATRAAGIHLDISERKEREGRLRMLAQAVQQANESVLITEAEPLDRPGPRIVYVNEAFEEMTGYGKEEVLGRTPRLLQGPETDRAALDELRAALESGGTWAGETVNYRKDGTPYRQEWNLAPVRGEDGAVEYWVSVQRDVTEEREREETLRRQKALLEQTQRLAGAWETDVRTREVRRSEEALRVYELGPDATLEVEDVFSFVRPEARPALREAFEQCVEEKQPYDLELPIETAKENRRWIRAVGAPAETENGEVLKVAGAVQNITARKEAEQELRQSRERYRSLFRDSSDAILIHDLEGTVREVNPQAESLFGLEAEALRGRSLGQLHEDSEAEVAQEKLRALREGETYEAVSLYKRAGGPMFWGEVSASTTQIGDETVARSLIRNVTDRVESRRELEQYREYTSHLLDAIDDLFFLLDEEGRFRRWNDSVLAVTGYTDAEIETMTAFDLVPESEHDRVATKITEALETGSAQIEVPLVRKDGTQISYEFAGSLVEHPEGELRAVAIGRDITERKRRKRKLERQNDLFEKAQDIASVGGWEYNAETGESLATDEVYQIYGLSPEADLTVEQGIELYHPDDRSTIRKAFRRAAQDGEPYDLEVRLITEGGEERWVRTRGEPQFEDEQSGEVARVRGTIQDVTAQVERRQALKEAKEAAEEAGRIKTALLSNMSHEFRTPLTSIITFSELIRNDPDVAGQFAGRILGGGKRLLYTLNTVMDFAELEGGGTSATPKRAHLPEIVRSVTSGFQERARKEGVDLSADVSGQVGTAVLDEHLFERMLIHLVHNAIKFTEDGEVTVFARSPGDSTGDPAGEAVEIGVEDTGVGIDPDFLPKVFDEFAQQSNGTDRTHEGNGLGLTVAKRFTEKMGGTIDVESEPGEGTVVTVRLPQAAKPSSEG